MIRQSLLPSIILIVLASCGAQKNLRPSKDDAPSEKILIIGAGSVASEIFMENLTKNITVRLNKRIGSHLIFLKNIKPGSPFNKTSLNSLDYDAYIIFYPLDSSKLVMNRTGQIPFFGGTRLNALVPNSYKQKFLVQIYMKTDKAKPVWETSLHVDLDPIDEEKYNDISSYILNYLPLY
jgi:hypothetical protein